jgi:regulator of protease activity HflC (stomatin/prohibitin superfamily)
LTGRLRHERRPVCRSRMALPDRSGRLGLAYALYALNGSRGAGVVLVAAAQTARRDAIGKTQLADMLEGRDKMSTELQRIIDHRTEPCEINVVSVEVRDVLIPAALEDAMSMQAQAERERRAPGDPQESDRQVAEKFREAPRSSCGAGRLHASRSRRCRTRLRRRRRALARNRAFRSARVGGVVLTV